MLKTEKISKKGLREPRGKITRHFEVESAKNGSSIQERRKTQDSQFRMKTVVMKEEIINIKMGSGSTACSEASTGVELGLVTFARPPSKLGLSLGPAEVRVQGWNLEFLAVKHARNSRGSRKNHWKTREKTMTQEVRKWIDWEQELTKDRGQEKLW